jgi:hypothetical protein
MQNSLYTCPMNSPGEGNASEETLAAAFVAGTVGGTTDAAAALPDTAAGGKEAAVEDTDAAV